MWFLNIMYFNLILLDTTLAINHTVDDPVAANKTENEILDRKIFKNSDVDLNVMQFRAFLKKNVRRIFFDYTLKPLTNLGDNFGGLLQALEVKLIDGDLNHDKTLHLVYKTTPLIINERASSDFTKEIQFYSVIVPAIQHFEKIENVPKNEQIDGFAQYFGSRLSLNSSASNADSNAALLLENLKYSNYVSKDRTSRLARDEVKATLKVLAKMHALGISLRQKQPAIFNEKINPHLKINPLSKSVIKFEEIIDELHSVFTNYSGKVLAEIKRLKKPSALYILKTEPNGHTPYTTICHRDLWIKNIMIQKDNTDANSKIQVKIIDFQIYRFESFANDLTYFLLACARLEDLRTSFRSFIEYYHLEFTKKLEYVDIPLDDYTYDKIWQETKKTAKLHLLHVLRNIKIRSAIYGGSTSKGSFELIQDVIGQPAPDIVLFQWRSIIDLFIENEFI